MLVQRHVRGLVCAESHRAGGSVEVVGEAKRRFFFRKRVLYRMLKVAKPCKKELPAPIRRRRALRHVACRIYPARIPSPLADSASPRVVHSRLRPHASTLRGAAQSLS